MFSGFPEIPTADLINNARQAVKDHLVYTPVLELASSKIKSYLPSGSRFYLKLEIFQHTGSFKARGNYIGLAGLTPEEQSMGVVTASGGNHGLALAWAAQARGVACKVVMSEATDLMRIQGCRDLGAEVILKPDVAAVFSEAERIAREEKRCFMHPYNDHNMIMGAAVCGAEIIESTPQQDVIILPIGGGGLIAGVASAFKAFSPTTTVIGVEPKGADSMKRSFSAGKPIKLDKTASIADSLAALETLPYSFGIARQCVDEIITIDDDLMASMMLRMRDSLSLMVEPACAASLAAALGPLAGRLGGKSVGVIACGSNISSEGWHRRVDGVAAFGDENAIKT